MVIFGWLGVAQRVKEEWSTVITISGPQYVIYPMQLQGLFVKNWDIKNVCVIVETEEWW